MAVGMHQMRDGLIALIGGRLRGIDVVLHGELPTGKIVIKPENLFPYRIGIAPLHYAGGGNRPGVDQRIHLRSPILLDGMDGIERLPGSIHPHGIR